MSTEALSTVQFAHVHTHPEIGEAREHRASNTDEALVAWLKIRRYVEDRDA